MTKRPDPIPESRLDALREEARATGTVAGRGVPATGGPMPVTAPGYYGRPIVKPPAEPTVDDHVGLAHGLQHVAEGREGLARQRLQLDPAAVHRGVPSFM